VEKKELLMEQTEKVDLSEETRSVWVFLAFQMVQFSPGEGKPWDGPGRLMLMMNIIAHNPEHAMVIAVSSRDHLHFDEIEGLDMSVVQVLGVTKVEGNVGDVTVAVHTLPKFPEAPEAMLREAFVNATKDRDDRISPEGLRPPDGEEDFYGKGLGVSVDLTREMKAAVICAETGAAGPTCPCRDQLPESTEEDDDDA